MRYRLLWLLFFLCNNILFAQTTDYNKPKLVVAINIDGLKNEHLTLLYNRLSEGGLRRIVDGGISVENVEFNYISKNPLTDVASIHTATTPSRHGIVGDRILSALDNDFVSITDDPTYHGIYSSLGRSASNLTVTNVADMLKIASPKSKVVSIAIDADKAIVMGGHNADGVVWIDSEVSIASTDYYSKIPVWASSLNSANLLADLIKKAWRPTYSLHTYLFPPFSVADGCFYSPPAGRKPTELMGSFVYTPYANTLVNELAKKAIDIEALGTDNYTDMLCLGYNVYTSFDKTSELTCAEKEDIYLRLDRDLSELLRVINEKVKTEHTLIVVTGTQSETISEKTLSASRLPTGKFDGKRMMALLNSFLMAKYGQVRWVMNYADGNIFLNNTEIDNRNVDRERLFRDIFIFLSQIRGISAIYSAEQLQRANGDNADVAVRLKNYLCLGRCGDILISLSSGWVDIDTDGNESRISSSALQYSPLLFYGINLEKSRVGSRHFVTDIAPTLCKIMQIPYPSASIGNAIVLKTHK